ncbi:complement C1q binding protein P32 isoform X2 [Megachile rotundata]|uniref:complement C1q binding protein P32 isoform X2 n=1 Tax=Megachile rotundata TaxID=143995 RepID=UPI003FD4713F
MNGIIRNTLRSSVIRNFFSSTSSIGTNNQLRTLWNACSRQNQAIPLASTKSFEHRNTRCNYDCCRGAHTKAEKELVEFLAEEIIAEKKAQKLKTIPTELDGFKVSLNGSQVTLEKKQENETVKISFDINHSVSSETQPDLEMTSDNPDLGDIKSKPDFTVNVVRGNQTLKFTCSFNSEPGASDDIFSIDEISLYTGECTDNVYIAEGAIIDGYLYDLLMNYLEEKGVSNELAEKLVELSTSYEHTAYVSLLEGLSNFTSKN